MKNRVNLLLPKEKNISDKIIYFALHYLRYILVITQLCVIGVFFYRFQVDQKIIDLKDELEQKKEIVAVSQPLIKEAEAIDTRIKSIDIMLNKQETLKQTLDYILSIFPEKIRLDGLKIKENNMQLLGIAQDPEILKIFYNRLKKDSRFTTISLKNIKRTAGGFNFTLDLSNFRKN